MRRPAVMLLLAVALAACRTAPRLNPSRVPLHRHRRADRRRGCVEGALHRRRPGRSWWCLVVGAGRVGVRHAVDRPRRISCGSGGGGGATRFDANRGELPDAAEARADLDVAGVCGCAAGRRGRRDSGSRLGCRDRRRAARRPGTVAGPAPPLRVRFNVVAQPFSAGVPNAAAALGWRAARAAVGGPEGRRYERPRVILPPRYGKAVDAGKKPTAEQTIPSNVIV